MDKQKGARWLYITLLIAAILIGIWMVIDFVRDGKEPEATPSPQVQESASPQPSDTPAATPAIALENDFTLENLEGDPVTLSDHLGKVTVINFWGAWCGWCMYEMPEFAEMVEHYGDDAAFLFVDYGDDADTARAAMEEYGVPLKKVLMDTENTVTNLYQVEGFPTTFILDQEGGVVEKFVGATSKDDVMPIIDGLLAD